MDGQRKTSRRQFLQGESAVEALGDLTHGTAQAAPAVNGANANDALSAATFLVQLSRQAMACEFQIFLTADHAGDAPDAAVAALDLVEQLEDQLTVYRDHSEVSQLNRLAAFREVPVRQNLFDLLEYSLQLSRQTDGAFDITSGPLSKLWGFHRRQGRVPSVQQLADTLARVSSDRLQLNPANKTVRFADTGVEVNFGGIGKGYALDQAAATLVARGVPNFLFHGGKSSVFAAGARLPAAADANPWIVGIGHPLRPELRLGEVKLRGRALSTSGTATQSFHHQGRRLGHILDLRTGWPVERVLSTTVIAPQAAAADALSTAFYVLGPHATEEYCRQHRDVSAIVTCPGSKPGSVGVHTFNLDEETWNPT